MTLATLDYARIRSRAPDRTQQSYTRTDCILYALGIGVGQSDPTDPNELKYVYEECLQALPMMAVVLAAEPFWMREPHWGIDWQRLVHGEQTLRLHKPLAPEGLVSGSTFVEEIYDKGAGKGAVLYLKRELRDERDELVAEIGKSAVLRGNGGFGGPRAGAPTPFEMPREREPDASLELTTRVEQALIYRLSGDRNPLHIEPRVAAEAGFTRPILHGLCTYGIAGRALIRLLCGGDASRLRRLDARFAAPVYPGESLRIDVWHRGPGCAAFGCTVPARNTLVITNGRCDFVS